MLARKVRPVPSLVAALAALLALTACSDKKAPDTTAPAGYSVVKDDGAGFAVAVPSDWIQIPLLDSIDEFDKRAQQLQAQNRAIGPAVILARQLSQSGGELLAVSADGKSLVNLTVDKTKEKTLDQIGATVSKSLAANGATDIAQAPATTGAGPAVRLTFKYPFPETAENPQLANEVQYIVLKGGRSYVLTFINPPNEVPEAVAGSFKLR